MKTALRLLVLLLLVTPAFATCSNFTVQFMGDSITYLWHQYWAAEGAPFTDPCYLDNGASGNTTVDLLNRFQRDVANRRPSAIKVAYLIGTNDIAHSPFAPAGQLLPPDGHDYTLAAVEGRIDQLVTQTKALGMTPILATVPPVQTYFGRGWRNPLILQLNAWIVLYGATNGVLVIDYYSTLVDSHGNLNALYTVDGVHPNKAGFDAMAVVYSNALAGIVPPPPPVCQ